MSNNLHAKEQLLKNGEVWYCQSAKTVDASNKFMELGTFLGVSTAMYEDTIHNILNLVNKEKLVDLS